MPSATFRLKQFTIRQDRCAMKVGTDGVTLGAWANVEGAERILDIGTGTGLLALMAAQRNSQAVVDAIEIDHDAAEQATANVQAAPWPDRVRVHHMDARRMHATEPFDVVVCNPPFYSGEMDAADARTSVAKHSAELSFGELVTVVKDVLAANGRFAVIVPANREAALLAAARIRDLHVVRRAPLWYVEGRPFKRVLLEFAGMDVPIGTEEVIVEHVPGTYTDAYRALLAPFLLKF